MQIDAFADVLKQQGIRCGAGVPCSFFKPLVNHMEVDAEMDYIPAASEGEAVAVAAGLVSGGRPAFALMQNSGLGNAVNPVTSMLYIYGMPVVLLVSQRGEPGIPDEPQHELMGRITEDLARLCALRTHGLDELALAEQLAAARADGVPSAFICRKGQLQGGPQALRRDIVLRSGQLTLPPAGSYRPAMMREDALRLALPLLNGGSAAPAVVSTTGKLSRELYELDDRDHSRCNRFYMVGSMGCAAGFGLGVARAQPQRKVVVLDGDGALLMKLGTLATIGALSPANLHHIVFDNAAHESTGGQATCSPAIDFATVAAACGYRLAETVADEADYAGALDRHFSHAGPTLLRVAIRVGSRDDLGRPSLAPRAGWARFCDFLADGAA